MWSYFDLNKRAAKTHVKSAAEIYLELLEASKSVKSRVEPEELLKDINFSLEKTLKSEIPPNHPQMSLIRQIFLYLGIFIGVLFSTGISQFRKGEQFNITITIGTIVVSAIIALILVPNVYEKLSVNSKAPFIVQFGLFVQSGVFWHVIINSIGKVF